MKNCAKCKKEIKNMTLIAGEGKTFPLCDACYQALKDMPTSVIQEIILKDENWVTKTIREEREGLIKKFGCWETKRRIET